MSEKAYSQSACVAPANPRLLLVLGGQQVRPGLDRGQGSRRKQGQASVAEKSVGAGPEQRVPSAVRGAGRGTSGTGPVFCPAEGPVGAQGPLGHSTHSGPQGGRAAAWAGAQVWKECHVCEFTEVMADETE